MKKERQILFSGPMVRALLEGRKTQTRRVVKPQPEKRGECGAVLSGVPAWYWSSPRYDNGDGVHYFHTDEEAARRLMVKACPYGVPGDRLWVKHSADLFPVYWKPIPGWEGVYAAGTDGTIYRVDGAEPSPLKPSPTGGKGYPSVSLSRGGEWTTYLVHRLVCAAFYGREPLRGAQVRHCDGDMNNNRPENLDWGTQEQNWQDRKAHGRGMGESHHNSKLTVQQVAAIRESSRSQRALAMQYGVSRSTVGLIRTGGTWGEHEPAPRNAPAFSLWRSPLFCPRWASRLTLELTGVRVERLHEIRHSIADLEAEGIALPPTELYPHTNRAHKLTNVYGDLWDSLATRDGTRWDANPWVWVLTFTPEVARGAR